MKICKYLIIIAVSIVIVSCNNQKTFQLTDGNMPAPQISGGKPLMIALRDRRTTRDFSNKELSMQQISNLLWAANGINRPNDMKHTAPTANNKQELDIYVAMKSGVYFFDADHQKLNKLFNTDIRSEIGEQEFHKIVPIELILVADLEKVHEKDTANYNYDALDAGYISQNIYLYCASENLATVAVGWLKHEKIAELLHLTKRQKVVLAHPVGFKK